MKMPSALGIERPFKSVPSYDRYLAIGSIEEARTRLSRMIERGEGLGVVIGPPGTGKTLLCQRLAAQYRSSFAVVMLGEIRVSNRTALIQQVLFHLRQPHQNMDDQAMQLMLIDCLTKGNEMARPLLLIIDEAQMLSVELLDEIRMLTNLVRDGRPLVQTILAGNSKLEDPLADPQMESLSQRIAARCYLHPMNHAETAQYIRSFLAASGMSIDDDAVAAVHHACGGVPRLINQLMNQTLEFATLHRKSRIDEMAVQYAWSDLQQLPSPVLEPQLRRPGAAVEFGELDYEESLDAAAMVTKPVTASKTSGVAHVDPSVVTKSTVPMGLEEPFGEPESFDSLHSSASYMDIESILSSPIICSPESMTMQSTSPSFDELASEVDGHAIAFPQPSMASKPKRAETIQRKTTQTTIVPGKKKGEKRVNRDELFGIDFSDEMLVDVRLADPARRATAETRPVKAAQAAPVPKVTQPARPMSAMVPEISFADEELSLHSEILKLSQSAKQASAPKLAEFVEDLPRQAADVPAPMAVVWSDEESDASSIDDRDILVIEDEVAVIVDPPAQSKIGSGAMRQPTVQVDRQYQGLFSRLRRGN